MYGFKYCTAYQLKSSIKSNLGQYEDQSRKKYYMDHAVRNDLELTCLVE